MIFEQIWLWGSAAILVIGLLLPMVMRFAGAKMFTSTEKAGEWLGCLLILVFFWPLLLLLGGGLLVCVGIGRGYGWLVGVKE